MTAKKSVASQINNRTRRMLPHTLVLPRAHRQARGQIPWPQDLRMGAGAITLSGVSETFGEFDATSLFCTRCKRATPVRKKLLLVLPTGNKYDYTCSVCSSTVGGKTDSDSTDFFTAARPSRPVNPAASPRRPWPRRGLPPGGPR